MTCFRGGLRNHLGLLWEFTGAMKSQGMILVPWWNSIRYFVFDNQLNLVDQLVECVLPVRPRLTPNNWASGMVDLGYHY